MKTILLVVLLASTFVITPAGATTWTDSKVKDPVSGKSVKVHVPMSSGSYIYSWPGKEDQVFWPATDENWLWFNPKTGYAAFGDDFEELAGAELMRVRTWLAAHYDKAHPPKSRLEKLAWMEKVYAQRDMDEEFWCFYYRFMAFEHAETDPARSLEYVRKALPMLEKELLGTQEDFERLVTLYLVGEYHRRLGDTVRSRDFFDQARAATYKDEDGNAHVGSEYINGIIAEREALNEPVPSAAVQPAN
jgi:hypothetical protein